MPDGSQRQRVKPKTLNEVEDDMLVELVELLQKIDAEEPLAKLNQTTITDNNGRRIYL